MKTLRTLIWNFFIIIFTREAWGPFISANMTPAILMGVKHYPFISSPSKWSHIIGRSMCHNQWLGVSKFTQNNAIFLTKKRGSHGHTEWRFSSLELTATVKLKHESHTHRHCLQLLALIRASSEPEMVVIRTTKALVLWEMFGQPLYCRQFKGFTLCCRASVPHSGSRNEGSASAE